MEYTLDWCSAYNKIQIAGKDIYVFDTHNLSLPVWGTYASKLQVPMHLLTFDYHCDTHGAFNLMLMGHGIPMEHRKAELLKIPVICDYLKTRKYKTTDFSFEDVFVIASDINNTEQILTGIAFDYLCSYTIINHTGNGYEDEDRRAGNDATYICDELLLEGKKPELRKPIALDIDLDYFINEDDLKSFIEIGSQFAKEAEVITIAREPKYCRGCNGRDAADVEREVLVALEGMLS